MKKTTKIRNVLTDEMIELIRNKDLTSAQVGDILRFIIFPGEFEVTDGMAKVFAESFRRDYLELCLSCAESKLKEVERLRSFYESPKRKCPSWFAEYYEKNHKYYQNIIKAITNIIKVGNNDLKHYQDIIKACDNVPLILDNVIKPTNINININQIKSNQTKRDRDIDILTPISPKGDEELPPQISADDLLNASEEEGASADEKESLQVQAIKLAETLENTEAYARMRVNRKKLIRCLISVLKKNSGADAEILAGLEKWTEVWKLDDWQYVPGRITDWIYDGKYLQEPRKKTEAAIDDHSEVGVSEIV